MESRVINMEPTSWGIKAAKDGTGANYCISALWGGVPPRPPLTKTLLCAARVRATRRVYFACAVCVHAIGCQAAILNTLSIRMAVLFLFFYHPWQPMRALHGTAVRTQEKKSRERSDSRSRDATHWLPWRVRLETIKISVAKRHKDGAYSKRTKKSRA